MPGDGGERGGRADARAEQKHLQGIENALKELNEKIDGMNRKINKIEEKTKEQAKMMKMIEEIVKENKQINEEFKRVKSENDKLKQKINNIEKDLEQAKNKEKRNYLEIVGVPKEKDEITKKIVTELAEGAEIRLDERDIIECYRINPRNGKEGPIVVKLKETKKRDEMIKELKRLKPTLRLLKREPGQKKIYINESLTSKQKEIFFKVRQIAKEKNWYRTWTFSGDTYIKMEKEGFQIKINSQEDIDTLLK